ncbi:unannotated protein [freshwater metagenome]|uniref:Unannotated protein n=1 Tax=freshwater metagenome TaxID=449393 RepID=A0A6J7NEF6_9ZZZZ
MPLIEVVVVLVVLVLELVVLVAAAASADKQGDAVAKDRQRGARHDEQAEGEEEDEGKPGYDRADGGDDRRRDEPADHPAASLHRCGAIARRRCSASKVPEPHEGQQERSSADDQAPG